MSVQRIIIVFSRSNYELFQRCENCQQRLHRDVFKQYVISEWMPKWMEERVLLKFAICFIGPSFYECSHDNKC